MARGRKQKLNSDYFSHDNDMRLDPDVVQLRKKYGHYGYAVWCMLLEILCGADYTRIELTDKNVTKIVKDIDIKGINLQAKKKHFQELLEYMSDDLDLLKINENFLICENLSLRISPIISKRIKEREKYAAQESENQIVIPNNKNPQKTDDYFLPQKKAENIISANFCRLKQKQKQKPKNIYTALDSTYEYSREAEMPVKKNQENLKDVLSKFLQRFELLFGSQIKYHVLENHILKNLNWIQEEYISVELFLDVMILRLQDKTKEIKIKNPSAFFIKSVFIEKYLLQQTRTEMDKSRNYTTELINERYPVSMPEVSHG